MKKYKLILIFFAFSSLVISQTIVNPRPVQTRPQTGNPPKDPVYSNGSSYQQKPQKSSQRENPVIYNRKESSKDYRTKKKQITFCYICKKCGCRKGDNSASYSCNSSCNHLWRETTDCNYTMTE